MTADYTWAFLKMLFALGAVSVTAVLVLKYVLPRWGLPKKFIEGQYFKVLARFYLAPKTFLCLIKAGKRRMIIGVGERGISLLKEVDDDEAEEKNPT